jgi:epoxyqueuosine reductase QueG
MKEYRYKNKNVIVACDKCDKCPKAIITSNNVKLADDYNGSLKMGKQFMKKLFR